MSDKRVVAPLRHTSQCEVDKKRYHPVEVDSFCECRRCGVQVVVLMPYHSHKWREFEPLVCDSCRRLENKLDRLFKNFKDLVFRLKRLYGRKC